MRNLVDGRAIGSLPSGSFFKAGIPAGKHSVAATSPPIISGMVNKYFDITDENGKVYYIADQLSTVAYKDGQTLGEIDDGRFGGTVFCSRYALVCYSSEAQANTLKPASSRAFGFSKVLSDGF